MNGNYLFSNGLKLAAKRPGQKLMQKYKLRLESESEKGA